MARGKIPYRRIVATHPLIAHIGREVGGQCQGGPAISEADQFTHSEARGPKMKMGSLMQNRYLGTGRKRREGEMLPLEIDFGMIDRDGSDQNGDDSPVD